MFLENLHYYHCFRKRCQTYLKNTSLENNVKVKFNCARKWIDLLIFDTFNLINDLWNNYPTIIFLNPSAFFLSAIRFLRYTVGLRI
jgi:hypothetical protein